MVHLCLALNEPYAPSRITSLPSSRSSTTLSHNTYGTSSLNRQISPSIYSDRPLSALSYQLGSTSTAPLTAAPLPLDQSYAVSPYTRIPAHVSLSISVASTIFTLTLFSATTAPYQSLQRIQGIKSSLTPLSSYTLTSHNLLSSQKTASSMPFPYLHVQLWMRLPT